MVPQKASEETLKEEEVINCVKCIKRSSKMNTGECPLDLA